MEHLFWKVVFSKWPTFFILSRIHGENEHFSKKHEIYFFLQIRWENRHRWFLLSSVISRFFFEKWRFSEKLPKCLLFGGSKDPKKKLGAGIFWSLFDQFFVSFLRFFFVKIFFVKKLKKFPRFSNFRKSPKIYKTFSKKVKKVNIKMYVLGKTPKIKIPNPRNLIQNRIDRS
mgnify:CR=1 FL=1